jgi:uncharacterized protein YceH (UPF0502 family)
MTINISNRMARKSVVKDLNGNIITMLDETNGGYIVRNRTIVNQEKWEEHLRREEDKKIAAQAILHQKINENVPDRTINPAQNAKVEALEKKVEDMDSKLDAILKAINK